MGKLIPLILIVLGIGAGLGAGLALRPVVEIDEQAKEGAAPPSYVSLPEGSQVGLFEIPNHFMVPLIIDERIASVLLVSLALEIDDAQRKRVEASLPRLRDALLQVLFDHANSGGFSGSFTTNTTLGTLRSALLEAGQSAVGRDVVLRVLITDIMRSGA